MYELQKVSLIALKKQNEIRDILYDCGKNMAEQYDIHHWDNSYIKTQLIVFLCELKNSVYLLSQNEKAIATFQVKKKGNSTLYFEKLAVSPKESGKGIGSYCVDCIEKIAKEKKCKRITMDVYSQSQHALDFYKKRGYVVCDEDKSLKYSLFKMEKKIQ